MTTTTAPPSEAEAEPTGSPTVPVIFLGLVGGLQLVDPAVANTALPAAARELGMSQPTVALAASVSTLALAATVLPFGVAADKFGRRKILMVALGLALIGDVIAALSPATAVYLTGRAVAGVGLGAALAATFAYVRFVAGQKRLASALGLWNMALMLIFMVGAVGGGALADSSWRLGMLLVPVLAAIGLLLTPVILKPMPKVADVRIDYVGMLVIAVAMVAFLYGVSQAGNGWTSPQFVVPTALGLLLFVVFFVVENRTSTPIFPPDLFLKGAFAAAIVAGIGWNFAQAVIQLQTSNFWQYVQSYTTTQVALGQLLFMAAFAIGGLAAGRLVKPGNRMLWLIGSGFAMLTVTFVLLTLVHVESSYWLIAPILFLGGLGLASVSVPQSAIFVAEAPKGYLGPVTAFRTTTGQLGYALGFALSAALVNAFGRLSLVRDLKELGVPPQQTGSAVDQVLLNYRNKETPSDSTIREALGRLANDYAAGFDVTMALMAVFMLLIGVIVLLLLIIGRAQEKEGPIIRRFKRPRSGKTAWGDMPGVPEQDQAGPSGST